MNRVFTFWAAVVLTASVIAQSPQKMSYQAVVRNASNVLVTSSYVGMCVSIWQGSPTGTEVYKETYNPNPQTNANGLVTIEIGGGTPVTGTFAAIDWSAGPYFIKTEIDPSGGTNYTITGTSQLLSVPYALYAKSVANYNETDPVYASSQAANITSGDITKLSNLSGTNTGDQDGSETKIIQGTNITITGNGTTINPYVINATVGATHYIGELYGGGVVFWVDQTGNHGLICSMIDLNTSQAWSNVWNLIGTTAQSDWDGQSNTTAIITQSGHTSSAAKLCNDYTNADYGTGIYSDWYLAARGELNDLWNSLKVVQKALDSDGNSATTAITKNIYWSSSEYIDAAAWSFYFTDGRTLGNPKDATYSVRAVRVF